MQKTLDSGNNSSFESFLLGALMNRREPFIDIAEHLHAGILLFDNNKSRVRYCSPGIERIFGITVSAFRVNRDVLMKSVYPKDLLRAEECREQFLAGEKLNEQLRMIDKNGMMKRVSVITVPQFDREGKLSHTYCIIQDTSKEIEHTETLGKLAVNDSLTGLPNRHSLKQYVDKHIKYAKVEGKPFAVLYLDLDQFELINDHFGHDVGDKLLIAISRRLLEHLNGGKAFIGRIAGDQFAILVEEIKDVGEAFPIAKRIIKEMEDPFYIEGYELRITVSIGISYFPADGDSFHSLIKNAARVLKKAKNIVSHDWKIYSSSMDVASYKSLQLERDLHKAIANHEFFLVYQPKVDAETGEITGAEALLRWNHPNWGTVFPGEFISIAKESGAIFELNDWVLKEVCAQIGRWKEEGKPIVPISVNVFPTRLLKADFTKCVKKLIVSGGIDPNLIELELTEDAIIENMEKIKTIIADLKEFGVKFSLDDFGTGNTSLPYLMDLNIDTLKIDKSIIDGIGSNKSHEAIIKSAIFVSKELGFEVVAEGVESIEQFNFLLGQGCDQIQGYMFSNPVIEYEFMKLLKKDIIPARKAVDKETPVKNRRKYGRIKFDFPLREEMTVLKCKDQELQPGLSKTFIENIGLGGLQYYSELDLPVGKDPVLLLNAEIHGRKKQFIGYNVWKKEVNGLYQYGLQFIVTNKEQDLSASIPEQLSPLLKSYNPLANNSFLAGSLTKYFGF